LWALLLSFPLPYIANTAGWMTAELGRQPWIIYGLNAGIRDAELKNLTWGQLDLGKTS